MDDQFRDLRQAMERIESRLSTVEGDSKVLIAKLDGFAPTRWVMEIIQPIRDSILEIRAGQTSVNERLGSLFAMHEKVLIDRAAQEKELNAAKIKNLEEQTFVSILKNRWGPVLGFLVTAGVIGGMALKLLEFLLSKK